MTPELKDIVEEAYRIFSDDGARGPLAVCRCAQCMTPEMERLLIKLPRRELPGPVLAEYTNSAHTWDDGPVARDMRYFLPRYLELIARDDPPDYLGPNACLRRLADAGWRTKWAAAEIEILDRFFDALVVARTRKLDRIKLPIGWRLVHDLSDVLDLIITAHGNLRRALDAWDGANDPEAAIHMAGLRHNVSHERARPYLYSAYLESEYRAEAEIVGAFLSRPKVSERIEAVFFQIEDPELQQILSDAIGT